MSQIFHLRLKPIFHCDAKLLELGARRNTKFVFPQHKPPTQVSQWNIGCVGSPTQNSCIGHVDLMLFILFFFCVGYPTGINAVLSGIWTLVCML